MRKLTITIEIPEDDDMTVAQEEALGYLCGPLMGFSEDDDPYDAVNPPSGVYAGMPTKCLITDSDA
jgi:hypothetical protein